MECCRPEFLVQIFREGNCRSYHTCITSYICQLVVFDRSMGISAGTMVDRIHHPEKYNLTFTARESERLAHLLSDSNLRNWSHLVDLETSSGNLSDGGKAEIIARYIEFTGQKIIEENPQLAREKYVPLTPDFRKFFNLLKRSGVRISIASSGRRTTIEPVLKLYGLSESIDAIYAEEDALSEETMVAYKPELQYYMNAIARLKKESSQGRRILPSDCCIVGDNAKSEYLAESPDFGAGFSTVLVVPKEERRRTASAKNVVKVPQFSDLVSFLSHPLGDVLIEGDPVILKRLHKTFYRSNLQDNIRHIMARLGQ